MNVPFEIDEIEDPNEDEIANGVIFRNDENQENIDGEVIHQNVNNNQDDQPNLQEYNNVEEHNPRQDVQPVGVRRPRPRRGPSRRRIDAPQYQNIRVAYNGGPETFLARFLGALNDGVHALITWQWDTTGGIDVVRVADIVEFIDPNEGGNRRMTRSMTRRRRNN